MPVPGNAYAENAERHTGGPEIYTLLCFRHQLPKHFSAMLILWISPVKINNRIDVKVTGVYEDLPVNTQFHKVQFFSPFDLDVASNPLDKRTELGQPISIMFMLK